MYSSRPKAHGLRPTAYGLRPAAHGLRLTVYGPRLIHVLYTAYGLIRPTVSLPYYTDYSLRLIALWLTMDHGLLLNTVYGLRTTTYWLLHLPDF